MSDEKILVYKILLCTTFLCHTKFLPVQALCCKMYTSWLSLSYTGSINIYADLPKDYHLGSFLVLSTKNISFLYFICVCISKMIAIDYDRHFLKDDSLLQQFILT